MNTETKKFMKDFDISRDIQKEIYYHLLKIRKVQLKIESLYHDDEMKTPVHLSLGQEGCSVGICMNLRPEDYIFSNHRSHAHYLAKGGDLKAMMAELYCKETGCSKGRGGSMHLIDTSVGHMGSSSIVGGGIPHAVGAAFAAKRQNRDAVAVTFFGDAASEEGVFFESMSLAALKRLPVLFVCENNFYSVCSHLSARQANLDIYKRARAFDIPSQQIDGMNVSEVYQTAQEVISLLRKGQGPYLLECRVQRWRGHAGSGDPCAAQYRKPEDLEEMNRRDPIVGFEAYMDAHDGLTSEERKKICRALDQEVDEAFQYAQQGPLPRVEDLEKYLFVD
jgi:pyruvate dehydrogenase E1 component alpha subunit